MSVTHLSGPMALTSTQRLVDAGEVNVDRSITEIETTGAAAITLADGEQGLCKYLVMVVSAGAATLTPANLSGGTTVTFNNVGDSAKLTFVNGAWTVESLNGAVLA